MSYPMQRDILQGFYFLETMSQKVNRESNCALINHAVHCEVTGKACVNRACWLLSLEVEWTRPCSLFLHHRSIFYFPLTRTQDSGPGIFMHRQESPGRFCSSPSLPPLKVTVSKLGLVRESHVTVLGAQYNLCDIRGVGGSSAKCLPTWLSDTPSCQGTNRCFKHLPLYMKGMGEGNSLIGFSSSQQETLPLHCLFLDISLVFYSFQLLSHSSEAPLSG